MRQILIAGLLALSATCAQAQSTQEQRKKEELETALALLCPGTSGHLVCLVLEMEKLYREELENANLRKQAEKEVEDLRKKQKQ